jgi:hypothetical protein
MLLESFQGKSERRSRSTFLPINILSERNIVDLDLGVHYGFPFLFPSYSPIRSYSFGGIYSEGLAIALGSSF